MVVESGEVFESLSSLCNNGITLLGRSTACWPAKHEGGKAPIVDGAGMCGSFKSIHGTIEVCESGCTDEVDKDGLKGGGSGWFIHTCSETYMIIETFQGGEITAKVCVREVGAELIMNGLAEGPSGRA